MLPIILAQENQESPHPIINQIIFANNKFTKIICK